MKNYFKLAIDGLKVVVRRFPIVLTACAAAGVFTIILAHETFDDVQTPTKILLCLVMFALISLNAKIAYECYEKIDKVKYAIILLAGACLAICFGLFWLDIDFMYSAVRYTAVIFALIMLFLALPYLGSKRGSESFTNKLGWRLAITGLYSGVLIGGLCALFFAIQELLNVNLIDEIYVDTAIVVLSLFSPMLFLSGIKQFESFTPNKLFKVLMVYILMPLLLAYTAVVYAYLIRIIFNNFEMPSGIVGNLVLWYGLVGIWVIFLSKEYLKTGFGKFFNRFYPIASVIPLITMFIALYLRINQYGFTESRYYSLIAGIWIFGMIIFFIVTSVKKRRNVVVLASLVVIAVLTVAGPWSAGSVSLRSQSSRLEKALKQENILVNGEIESFDNISRQATNIIYYIDRIHGFDDVDFLNETQTDNMLSMSLDSRTNHNNKLNRYYDEAVEISGYDFLVNIYNYEDSIDITENLYFEHDDGVIDFYLSNQLNLSLDLNKHYLGTLNSAEITLNDYEYFVVLAESDGLRVKLILQGFNYNFQGDTVEIIDYYGRLLVDIK